MSARGLRRRAADLADFRRLTDGEAEALLAARKQVNEPVKWLPSKVVDGAVAEVRMGVTVLSPIGEHLAVSGRVSARKPHASHWMLVWGSKAHREHPETIRRLDLRDDHVNPDGKAWAAQTHKHLWSATENNAWAYTPDDIPHDPAPLPVGAEDYHAVFEAFTGELGIALGPDYTWSDPQLPPVQPPDTLWEVP